MMPITSAPPPPRNAPNIASSGAKPKSTPRVTQEREECVTQLGMFAQVPLMATRQLADAAAIGLHWPNISREVAKLAETQEAVANVIDPLIKVGPYAGLIAAAIPLIAQLAVNHGRLQAGQAGTVPATTLQSQMETTLAQVELEATRAQLEAERAAAAMRKEIAESRAKMSQEMADVSA